MINIKKNGYSLLEVLVAIFLISFCVLFIITILPTAFNSTKISERTSAAMLIADNMMDIIDNVTFAQAQTYNGYSLEYVVSGITNQKNYTDTYIYQIVVSPINSRTKSVLLVVYAPPVINPAKCYKLETIIFDKS